MKEKEAVLSKRFLPALIAGAILCLGAPVAAGEIDPEVDTLIRKSCTTIAEADSLCFL